MGRLSENSTLEDDDIQDDDVYSGVPGWFGWKSCCIISPNPFQVIGSALPPDFDWTDAEY